MIVLLCEIVGALLLAIGVAMLSLPAGVIAAGLMCLAFGVAADRRA